MSAAVVMAAAGVTALVMEMCIRDRAGFLRGLGVDTLICGGIGGGARSALAEAGIQLYPGASGSADAQVEALLDGSLAYDPNTVCSHHDHGEGHTCGHQMCIRDR